IILNFWTTYVSKSGQVVYHLKAIAINYLRGWFFLDLLAAIPFDVILAVNNPEIQGTIGEMGNWIHLLKLARLLRLARLFQKIERYSQYSTVILGLLMCMFFLVAHWFACGWYCIGKEEFKSKITREYSWLYELGERMQFNRSYMIASNNKTNGLTRRALYVSSLYFTTTSLTSVGFGNVSPNTVNEKIFAVITMLIGALMHAAVFGNVTTLIQRMYSRRSAYQTKNQDLKDFTRAHHIPKPLKQRMLEFFQAMWAINRGIDKEAILQSFPENLRGDIALHLNREILSLSLFKSASPGCRKCLAQLITTRFATPGEYLVNQGDVLRFIYFVCSGSLEILGDEGTVVGLLGKCDIFGSDMDDMPILKFSAYNSSLELIPAITVTTDKDVHFNDHSNNTTYKCNEVTNNIDNLLSNSHQNTSFENINEFSCHDNNNQLITSNYNIIQTNYVINSNDNHFNQKLTKISENTKNISQKNKFFIKKKQNSLDLYLKQTFNDQYNNEIKQLNKVSSIEQLNEFNNIPNTTYNIELNNNFNDFKQKYYNHIEKNHLKQNSINSVVYCIKHKCKSLDTIYQNDKMNRIYSLNKVIYTTDNNLNDVNEVFMNSTNNNNNNIHDNDVINQLISLLSANFNYTQHEMNIIKLEQVKINEKLDRIHTDFVEFMKCFKRNENVHNNNLLDSNTFKTLLMSNNNSNSNNNNNNTIHNNNDDDNNNNARLKTIHSITENDIMTTISTNITHNKSSNSCSSINIKNVKDDTSTIKCTTSSTMINSRPCLHQYGRTHYSPENRVVTFQLPPRNHDFRSQSLTSSRQISPDTPKSNPFKKLLHKHPSVSHEID
ncbi:Potassium voltage-gated channel subfamily H member 8, partial [Schistosoma japonicum]